MVKLAHPVATGRIDVGDTRYHAIRIVPKGCQVSEPQVIVVGVAQPNIGPESKPQGFCTIRLPMGGDNAGYSSDNTCYEQLS
jgi:hypothetical protein